MKDSTRQIIYLAGIMSILMAAFVTVNTAGTSLFDVEQPANNTSADDNRSLEEKATNSTGLLRQSFNGLKLMWRDFNNGIKAVSGG